jgi:uncharacterized protein (DUF736 family)
MIEDYTGWLQYSNTGQDWRSLCMGDPEFKKRLVSNIFWNPMHDLWVLIIYDSRGKLKKLVVEKDG